MSTFPRNSSSRDALFAALKKQIVQLGLLERQPRYYVVKVALTLALLIPGVFVLIKFSNVWVQALNAVYFAFAFTQIVFLGHDCGHRQVFRKAGWNDWLALLGMPLVGVSYSWWCDAHNRHHRRPNEVNADPAIDYDLFAFSQSQAIKKERITRSLIKFQAFYFLPLTIFYPMAMRLNSVRFMLNNKLSHPVMEPIQFLLHFPLYFWLVFSHLSLGTGLLFIAIHQSCFSLFLVSTFAPNHKGMMILDEDHDLDFIHQQVLTAKNVQSTRFADFWFGGLNYQIEHHLFPNMPRNKLREAQKTVKSFCRFHSIPYAESTAPRCYWEILKFMHEASRPLRRIASQDSNI